MLAPNVTRYRAFICYSHKDRAWGDWLHKTLENYRVDRDLVGRETATGKIVRTLRPIFRDRDDFATGHSLREATIKALDASDFLIVVCSPNSAASRYVNEEIRLFKAMGRAERVIAFIVEGEPGDAVRNCFPPALRFAVGSDGVVLTTPEEPIAADAREEADGREIAKQKIIAGLLGIGLDEIRKRAARAHRRRMAALGSVAIVMGALAISATVAAWIARTRTIEAEHRLDWALETASAVTTKAATFKNKFGVPVPVLSELLLEVEQLLGRLSNQGVNTPQLTLREAKMMQELSDSNRDLGDTTKALELLQRAAERLESIAGTKIKLTSVENELGWTYLKIGDILNQHYQLSAAKEKYLLAKKLFIAEGSDLSSQVGLSATLSRLSDTLSSEGNQSEAIVVLDENLAIMRRLQAADPRNSDLLSRLSIELGKRGLLAEFAGQLAESYELRKEALDITDSLVKFDPTNSDWTERLANALHNFAEISDRRGYLADAIKSYESARQMRERLSKADPLNVTKASSLAGTLDTVAYAYLRMGRATDAVSALQVEVEVRRKIAAQNPADAHQKGVLSITLAALTNVYWQLGDTASALSTIEEASALGAELIRSAPDNDTVKAARVIHLGMVAVVREARGDVQGATSAVEEMVALSDEINNRDPTNDLKRQEVVIARTMLATKYRQQGKAQESLSVLEPARQIAERRFGEDPNDINWTSALSQVLEQMYLSYWDLDDLDAAMTAASRFGAVAKHWVDINVGNTEALQRLAVAYTVMGNAARRLNRLSDARKFQLSALEIRKVLTEQDEKNTTYKADLAISWSRLSAVLWEEEDYSAVLDAEQNAVTIKKELVEHDPSNIGWKQNLADSFSDVGRALLRLDRSTEARDAYQSALAIRQELAKAQPANPEWANDLAWAWTGLYEVSWDERNYSAALGAERNALAIRKQLADATKSNIDYQSQLASSHSRMGNALRELRSFSEARDAFEVALAIRQGLAKAQPANPRWAKEVAWTRTRLYGVLWRERNYSAALDAERDALAIRNVLADGDKSNVGYQQELARSYSRVGDALRELGRWAEARDAFEAALMIRRELAQARPEDKELADEVSRTMKRLSDLELQVMQSGSSAQK